jgi:hypothetical protein
MCMRIHRCEDTIKTKFLYKPRKYGNNSSSSCVKHVINFMCLCCGGGSSSGDYIFILVFSLL